MNEALYNPVLKQREQQYQRAFQRIVSEMQNSCTTQCGGGDAMQPEFHPWAMATCVV